MAIAGGLTSWVTAGYIEHLAGVTSDGHIHEFWWSPDIGKGQPWQTSDVSAHTTPGTGMPGTTTVWLGYVAGGRLTHSIDPTHTTEHLAGLSSYGNVIIFGYPSNMAPNYQPWQTSDVSSNAANGGQVVTIAHGQQQGGLTSWVVNNAGKLIYSEHLARISSDGHVHEFWQAETPEGHVGWRTADVSAGEGGY